MTIALCCLGAALLFGVLAALYHLRARPIPAWLTLPHGILALCGFAALFLALRGAARGAASGTQSFGAIAETLLGLAVLAGVAVFWTRRRRPGIAGALLGVHATLAVSGIVILAAYALLS